MTDFKVGDRVNWSDKLWRVQYVKDTGLTLVEVGGFKGAPLWRYDVKPYECTPEVLPAEQRISDLEGGLREAVDLIHSLEDTIYYLRQDVERKAGENHSHYDLESKIRDTEYHSHYDYARERHTHDRWDMV